MTGMMPEPAPDGVADFTDAGEAAYARFAEAGMRRVRSTHPADAWLPSP